MRDLAGSGGMHSYVLPASIAICLCGLDGRVSAQGAVPPDNPLSAHPMVIGLLGGGGGAIADHVSNALGESKASLDFTNAGVRLGKVMNSPHGRGAFENQFEIASEFLPFWQATYPKQQLVFHLANGTASDPDFGYTIRGVSLTPIQLRLDLVRHPTFVPWVQIACGVLWTTSDFPTLQTASVNFTPQAGLGAHLFTRTHQSVDFAANAVHLSNGSTADNNPGVNVTIQASIGYSWWFHRAR